MARESGSHARGKLHYFGYPETAADVAYVRHDPTARTARASKALLLCWGLALLSILVPIAHFVLVPGFALMGIALFVKRMGEAATITGVEGVCPKCGEPRTFQGGGRLKPNVKVQCPVCRNELDLAVEGA